MDLLKSADDTSFGDPWLDRIAQWDDSEADARIRSGISIDLLHHLQELLELTDRETAELIGRSRSTYARYRSRDAELGAADAERALRYARLLSFAADTLGSLDEARHWMKEENYALGGTSPFELAKTEPGANVVYDLLGGLQHGHIV